MGLGSVAANAVAKLFIMMLVGIVASLTNVVDERGTTVLSKTVTRVVNPIQLFCSYCIAFDKGKLNNLLSAAGLTLVAICVSIVISLCLIRKRSEGWRVERVSMAMFNCGFMGIPLITAMFGSEYVFYLTGCIMTFNIMAWTYGAITLKGSFSIKNALKQLISPCIIAILSGFLLFLSGYGAKVPDILHDGLVTVGNCTTPLSMMVAGTTIARAKFTDTLRNKKSYLVLFTRLLLSPLIFICICQFLSIPADVYKVVITAAACPIAVVVVSQCVEFKRQPGYAAGLFALASLFSIGTIPAVLWLESYIVKFFA